MPSLLLIGAAVAPVTFTTFIGGLLGRGRLSVVQIAIAAALGGVIGTVVAGTLEYETIHTLVPSSRPRARASSRRPTQRGAGSSVTCTRGRSSSLSRWRSSCGRRKRRCRRKQHRRALSHVVDGLTSALDELREIALGIHPAGLSEGGLTPALKTLARRSPIPVNVDIRVGEGRFPEPVQVTAYYVVSEALTNAAKYAHASVVDITVATEEGRLAVKVRDDGRGGADPAGGSGLLGLRDRVEAIGGTMELTSSPAVGTLLSVVLPIRADH